MLNAAMKLRQGKLIVARLMFTTKHSCCYNNSKLPGLHAHNKNNIFKINLFEKLIYGTK